MEQTKTKLGDHEGGPIRLPNGIALPDGTVYDTVEMREMGGEEEDILVDEDKTSRAIPEVLKSVITKIGDVTATPRIRQLVDYLPQPDATYLCVRLRQMSLGNRFIFAAKCPIKKCQHIDQNAYVDLNERFCTYRDDKIPLRAVYEGSTGDDFTFSFRRLTLADQRVLREIQLSRKDARASMILHLQLVEVNGGPKPEPDVIAKWTSRRRNAIREAMDAQHYGLDIEVNHTCGNPECRNSYTMTMPITADSRFFFPSGTGRS